MLWIFEDIFDEAFFDLLTTKHHHNAVGHLCNHGHIMGYEHDGGAGVLFQLVHQPKNFRLDGHIQGGGWLIGNQEPRLAGECHGDDHPLAHTAG